MASQRVNRLVDEYRKFVRRNFDQELALASIRAKVVALDDADMADYVRMTFAIDDAADRAQGELDNSQMGEAASRQHFRRAVNHAGLDSG